MLPSEISWMGCLGETILGDSSSTSATRLALARERVSSKNTLEIIIREFITCNT